MGHTLKHWGLGEDSGEEGGEEEKEGGERSRHYRDDGAGDGDGDVEQAGEEEKETKFDG